MLIYIQFHILIISICIDIYLVKSKLQIELLSFEQFKGKKDLVLDTELMKPLDRVAGAIMLKVLL